jgi:tripartite-type tricarboxylate transporter receptor subunit TctC
LICVASAIGTAVLAEPYPAGPVKIIVQVGAGNGADIALREVARHLGEHWKQQVVVVNQPGAGGLIAARAAAAARPDGQTLFMALTSTYVALPLMQPNLPFNVNDFVQLGFVGEVPLVIAASPALPVTTLSELLTLSKKRDEGLTVAVPPRGDLPHLAFEVLRSRTGAGLTPVHYPNMSQAMPDVISGRVASAMEGLGGPSARGQLKLLAVAARTRVPAHPDIPAVSETVPDFVATGWWVLVAPRGTPSSVVQKVRADLSKVLARSDLNQKFQNLGTLTRQMSSQELSDFIRSEQQLWGPVIKRLGL